MENTFIITSVHSVPLATVEQIVPFLILPLSVHNIWAESGSCLTAQGNPRQWFRTGNEEHHSELELCKGKGGI